MQYNYYLVLMQEVQLMSLKFATNYYLIENKIYKPNGTLTDMMTFIARFALLIGLFERMQFC